MKSHRKSIVVTEEKKCSKRICELSALAVAVNSSLNGEITADGIIKYGILKLFLQTVSVILPCYSLGD